MIPAIFTCTLIYMEIHLKTHKTTAPYTGVWQKQALDRVSDCISFLRTKQQTAPVPMWQMPCPTPISLRRALCEGVIAAVFLFNTNTAFTALLHKQSQTWLQNHLLLGGSKISFGKCIYSFRTQGLHAALLGSLGMFQAYGLPMYPSRNDTVPEETKSNIKPQCMNEQYDIHVQM